MDTLEIADSLHLVTFVQKCAPAQQINFTRQNIHHPLSCPLILWDNRRHVSTARDIPPAISRVYLWKWGKLVFPTSRGPSQKFLEVSLWSGESWAGAPKDWGTWSCIAIPGVHRTQPLKPRGCLPGMQAALGCPYSPTIRQINICCNKVAQIISTFYWDHIYCLWASIYFCYWWQKDNKGLRLFPLLHIHSACRTRSQTMIKH